MKVFGRDINIPGFENKAEKVKVPAYAQASKQIAEMSLSRQRQDIASFRTALSSAESRLMPNRRSLLTIYADIVLDAHLSSVMKTLENKILAKQFQLVDQSGVEDKEATKVLEATWFQQFQSLCIQSQFYGYSLIQFSDLVGGKFTGLSNIPREHVKPELGVLVKNPFDTTGIDYREDKYAKWWMMVSKDPRDLGELLKVTPLLLYKKNVMSAYAQYCDLFGQPIRIGKTATNNAERFNSMQNFLRDMSGASWGVFDLQDELTILEGRKEGGTVFDAFVTLIDQQISKQFLGGTMITDSGSSRSQSEVHERVLEEWVMAYMRLVSNTVNDQLIPFLVNYHGFTGLEGLTFKFDTAEKFTLSEKADLIKELVKSVRVDEEYILSTFGIPITQMAVSQGDEQ